MSIEARLEKIRDAVCEYPSLAIELEHEQIYDGRCILYGGLTSHQKEACKIAGQISEWHPFYVAECCAVHRPALFQESTDIYWKNKAENWQRIHNLSVEELAAEYAEEMKSTNTIRLLEPIDWRGGIRYSAHDNHNDPSFLLWAA